MYVLGSAMCSCVCELMLVENHTGLYLHIPVYACVFMFVWIWVLVYHASQPVTHGFAAITLARVESVPAGWQRGRPSLWLTQAERGFLHIFCHTIWALVSVAALLRTHLAAHCADGHLLFPTSWWIEKTTTKRACSLTLCSAYFATYNCIFYREKSHLYIYLFLPNIITVHYINWRFLFLNYYKLIPVSL